MRMSPATAQNGSSYCLTSRSVNAATGTNAVPATRSAVIEKHTPQIVPRHLGDGERRMNPRTR